MAYVAVTGSSRGIGLEFVRQYARRGDTVFATCRNPDQAQQLQALTRENPRQVVPMALDVSCEEQIRAAANRIADQAGRLDILVNNAGCFAPGEEGLDTLDADSMLYVYHVNAVGPALMCKHLRPLLAKGHNPRVIHLTSGAGLLGRGELSPGRQYSYGATKAALNKIIRSLAGDLRAEGILCCGMAPGFVATDMTAGSDRTPPLTPEESVSGMIETIDGLALAQTGEFYSHAGEICRWMD
jgi:NAD(P)-dependent dehydrogenase (short-subunit alcohol dehydrogenase family)